MCIQKIGAIAAKSLDLQIDRLLISSHYFYKLTDFFRVELSTVGAPNYSEFVRFPYTIRIAKPLLFRGTCNAKVGVTKKTRGSRVFERGVGLSRPRRHPSRMLDP